MRFDESHFTLNGSVNKQNCRFYATENPQLIEEQSLCDQKVTVWCGVCADMVIGPYFFEDDDGATKTVIGDRYRAMINDFMMLIVRENDLNGFRTVQHAIQLDEQSICYDHCSPDESYRKTVILTGLRGHPI